MKGYQPKQRPVIHLPFKGNKANLMIGCVLLLILFVIVILLGRNLSGGETLQEYQNMKETTINETEKM